MDRCRPGAGGNRRGAHHRGLRLPAGCWHRGAKGSRFGPVRLDERCDTATVTPDRSVHGVDLGHPLCAVGGPAAQRLLRQIAEISASGRSATGRLHIDRTEEVVGQRHHHLGHTRSIPGVANRRSSMPAPRIGIHPTPPTTGPGPTETGRARRPLRTGSAGCRPRRAGRASREPSGRWCQVRKPGRCRRPSRRRPASHGAAGGPS